MGGGGATVEPQGDAQTLAASIVVDRSIVLVGLTKAMALDHLPAPIRPTSTIGRSTTMDAASVWASP